MSQNLFQGLVLWGSEFLPKDICPTLEDIREWAGKQNLIWDEAQIITPERVNVLRKHFLPEDGLAILIHLYKDTEGKLNYLEQPFIPVRTLIKKQKEVDLVYWQLRSTATDSQGNVQEFGEVRFGFWYPNIETEEFISMSNAKMVCQKFFEMFQKLSKYYKAQKIKEEKLVRSSHNMINKISEHILDIEVDGDVKAKFFKVGRFFDVELTVAPRGLPPDEEFPKSLQ